MRFAFKGPDVRLSTLHYCSETLRIYRGPCDLLGSALADLYLPEGSVDICLMKDVKASRLGDRNDVKMCLAS